MLLWSARPHKDPISPFLNCYVSHHPPNPNSKPSWCLLATCSGTPTMTNQRSQNGTKNLTHVCGRFFYCTICVSLLNSNTCIRLLRSMMYACVMPSFTDLKIPHTATNLGTFSFLKEGGVIQNNTLEIFIERAANKEPRSSASMVSICIWLFLTQEFACRNQ